MFDYRSEYVRDAKDGVGNARRRAARFTLLYWVLRLGVITCGALVAIFSAAQLPLWLVGTCGALAAAAEAVLIAANLQQRSVVCGLLADEMSAELRSYELQVGPYKDDTRIENLHEKIEDLRRKASTEKFRLDSAPERGSDESSSSAK
ncbi:SLATT domain-containing protein [Actinomycetospora endophytica]|uniref:SLATT domain-containing protein n=1 Tax=Actinomycetospora endophytica TaxID=2291215 RepID=A0ABS8P5I5_9PSEU|nr:SLATT domain-containing protein [Actinomycetospora endophytica]MCD2193525.1 SLATT domain-containing protein [Actinomycetospora endophytica]